MTNRNHVPPQPGPEGPPRLVLNLKHLRIYTLGDPALEQEVLGLFLADLPQTGAAIEQAIESDDWLGAVHRLRGAALGIGAERLADEARTAEHLTRSDQPARALALGALRREIEALVAEFEALGIGGSGQAIRPPRG